MASVQSRLIYVPTNIWWSWYYRCHPDVLIPGHCPPCPHPPCGPGISQWSSAPPPHWDSLIQTQSATAGIPGLTNRGQYKYTCHTGQMQEWEKYTPYRIDVYGFLSVCLEDANYTICTFLQNIVPWCRLDHEILPIDYHPRDLSQG